MDLKQKIIMSALEVFSEYGYEKATIAQIVKEAESSKGGFYHHFKSKEDVLDCITNMYFDEVVNRYNLMLEKTDEDTISLLNSVFEEVNAYKKEQMSRWDQLTKLYEHRDSHIIIRKLADDFEALIANIYERLILQGVKEGLFNPKNPKALAKLWSQQMVVLYGKINEIVMLNGDKNLCDDFALLCEFIEDTINHALNLKGKRIFIKKPAIEYLNLVLAKMKELQNT